MTDQMEQALAIQATMDTAGWQMILSLRDDYKRERMEELMDLMLRTPDKLTGKSAIKIGASAKAVVDFFDELADRVKILVPPTRKGGDRA